MGGGSRDDYPVSKSRVGWQMQLDDTQFAVLRRGATERPHSSELESEKRSGTYRCAGCETALFASGAKFDSGTGWPSFFEPTARDVVETHRDFKMVLPRTEIRCATCGGHLGHLFKDGPPPTGQRYCINGAALLFDPDGDESGDAP